MDWSYFVTGYAVDIQAQRRITFYYLVVEYTVRLNFVISG
jgi:hypothetical protein